MENISKRQIYANYLRKKYFYYNFGVWNPNIMSNRQVIKVLGWKYIQQKLKEKQKKIEMYRKMLAK